MADAQDRRLHLAETFPKVATSEWEAQIRRDLKGADYEKRLVWKTDEGIAVRPYYRAADISARPALANAAKAVPAPDMHMDKLSTTNNIGIVGIGGCHAAIREAVDVLRGESYAVDYMRICGFPFDQPVAEFIGTHQTVFVVEQNRDAQLRSLLAIEFGVPRDHMISILDYNGLPLTSQVVVDAVTNHLAGVAV